MKLFQRFFATCGGRPDADTESAGAGAADFADSDAPAGHTTITPFLASVRLPRSAGEPEDERIVRPSLAILFRMAVGPGADYYAPRFLEYERIGRSFPSWNWAALWAPGVWAIYRRLWLPGIAFAVWPLLALAAFRSVEPHLGESGAVSIAVAAFLIWLGPGLAAALVANTLVYRRARQLVRNAEAWNRRTDKAARWLSKRNVIAPTPAAFAGGAAILLALYVVVPSLQSAYADLVIRSRVAEGLAAIQPLQREIEEWFVSRSPSGAPAFEVAEARPGTEFLEAVSVSLTDGRVRIALSSLIPELSGRSILLAPAVDRRQQVRWICIPVDIPARYLPPECRQG